MGIFNSFRIGAASRGRIKKEIFSSQESTECSGVIVDDYGGKESGLARALPVGGIKQLKSNEQDMSGTRASNRQLGDSGDLAATFDRKFYPGKPPKPTSKRIPRALAALRTFNQDTKEEARLLRSTPRSKRRTASTRERTPARSKQARSTVNPATLRTVSNCDRPPSLSTINCRTPGSSKRKRPASLREPPAPLRGPSPPLPPAPACPVRRKKRSWHITQSGMGSLTCGAIRTVAPRSEAVSMPAQNVGTWEGTGVLPLCGEEGCMAPASYGFMESGRVDFCAKHAVDVGMVDLLDRRWGPDQDYCKDSTLICTS